MFVGSPIKQQLLGNTDDTERSGRLKSAVVPENITKVHNIVLCDRKLKLHEIPDTFKISEGNVFTILHESLGMRKLFSKWVPTFSHIRPKTTTHQGFRALVGAIHGR